MRNLFKKGIEEPDQFNLDIERDYKILKDNFNRMVDTEEGKITFLKTLDDMINNKEGVIDSMRDAAEKLKNEIEVEKNELGEDEKQRTERVLGFGEIRKKLGEFKEAREELVKAEKKGKNVEEAKENYEKMRAEYVGEKFWRDLKEQERVTETKAEKYKGLARKFYEWSSNKYLIPKNWVDKVNEWQPETKKGKISKVLAKMGVGMTSVRNITSYGLLGGGMALGASGVGIGAAAGVLAARRTLSGLGTGFGMYNTLNRVVDWKEGKKDVNQVLSPTEMVGLKQKEIVDRLEYIEAKARVRGQKVKEMGDYENYRNLKMELNRRFKETFDSKEVQESEKRAGEARAWLTKTRTKINGDLEEHYNEQKSTDKKVRTAAIGMGLFTAMGGIRITGKTFVSGLIKGEGGSGFTEAVGQEFSTYKDGIMELVEGEKTPDETSVDLLNESVSKNKVEITPDSVDQANANFHQAVIDSSYTPEIKTAIQDNFNNLPDSQKVILNTQLLDTNKLLQDIFGDDIKAEDVPTKLDSIIAPIEGDSITAPQDYKPEIETVPSDSHTSSIEIDEPIAEADKEILKQSGIETEESKEIIPEKALEDLEIGDDIKTYDGQLEQATVPEGKGVIYALYQQLYNNPEKFGYNTETDGDLESWASKIANKEGMKNYGDTWVRKPNKVAYVLKGTEEGGFSIHEVDPKEGKIMGTEGMDDHEMKPIEQKGITLDDLGPKAKIEPTPYEYPFIDELEKDPDIINYEDQYEDATTEADRKQVIKSFERYLGKEEGDIVNVGQINNIEMLEDLAKSKNESISFIANDTKETIMSYGTPTERVSKFLELENPTQKDLRIIRGTFEQFAKGKIDAPVELRSQQANLFAKYVTQSDKILQDSVGTGNYLNNAYHGFTARASSPTVPSIGIWEPRREKVPTMNGFKERIFNVKPQNHLLKSTDYLVDFGDGKEPRTIDKEMLKNILDSKDSFQSESVEGTKFAKEINKLVGEDEVSGNQLAKEVEEIISNKEGIGVLKKDGSYEKIRGADIKTRADYLRNVFTFKNKLTAEVLRGNIDNPDDFIKNVKEIVGRDLTSLEEKSFRHDFDMYKSKAGTNKMNGFQWFRDKIELKLTKIKPGFSTEELDDLGGGASPGSAKGSLVQNTNFGS